LSDQGALIGRMDEYLVHQTEKPIAQVASEHTDWQDRFYFNIHDEAGEFVAISGLGAYPNRNSHQGYLFAVHKGVHYSYLNVRPLNGDREVMTAGSLKFEIVEPLKSWRLDITDEANGLRGELLFEARTPLYTFEPVHWQNGDRTVVHQMHYTQSGRYQGSFRVGDRELTGLIGMRDRSWGIRAMPEVPMWIWVSAQFKDSAVTAWLWETPEGEVIHQDGAITTESGDVRPIKAIEHVLDIPAGRKCPQFGRYRFTMASGDPVLLTAEEMSSIYIGPMLTRWDEAEEGAKERADAAAFDFNQSCRFEMNGETGYGVIEYNFTGGVKKYGVPPTKMPGT
jgi:hypothetical protein